MARRSAILAVGVLVVGCGGGSGDKAKAPLPVAPERIKLSSPAFREGARIPATFTCDGDGGSPPLRWSGVPSAAKALALVMEDRTAKGFVHWTVLDIAPRTHGVAAGAVPRSGVETRNSFGDEGYGGPCPPDDDPPHRYEFVVYALARPLRAQSDAAPDEIRSRLRETALARGELTGSFR
jgi:Raf kinase inhibitor-like YbhB/YbcL family protein